MATFLVTPDGVCVSVDPIDLVAQAHVEGTLRQVRDIIINVLCSHSSLELERALWLIEKEMRR